MAFDALLIHTVEVYTRSGRTDRFGQAVDSNPRQHTAGENVIATYPCRAYQKSGGMTMQERSIDVFVRIWEVFFGLDADIRENDAVRVLAADGSVIINLAKVQSSATIYAAGAGHHKEFTIWEQSGPTPAR
jgi:hypothetical protein